MKLLRLFAGLAVLLAVSLPGTAGVIYSSFGTTKTYSPTSGWVTQGTGTNAGFVRHAFEFKPSASAALTKIDLGLGWEFGFNGANISLWTETGGLPGMALGSWNIGGFPLVDGINNSIIQSIAVSGVTLKGGTNYFLMMQPQNPADDSQTLWYANIAGILAPHLFDTGNGWKSEPAVIAGAFDVEGNLVPEPASLAMFGTILAGVVLRRRKRKAAV